MRNAETWRPTKFELHKGRWRASRDQKEVAVASRLAADRVALLYQKYIPAHCRGDLVDLGCGQAPLYDLYRSYVSSVTCVDWSHSAHADRHVDITCDLNMPLPMDAQSFDTIILSDVLEHLARPEAFWDEMRRVLRPGGSLLMNVPFMYWLHETPHDYYRYTEWALKRFAQLARMKVVALEATGGSPEVFADILAKHTQHIPLLGKPFAAFLQWMTAFMTASTVGQKLSRSTARVFPLGYFLVAVRDE